MVIEKMTEETYRRMMGEVLDQITLYEDTQEPHDYNEKTFVLDLIKMIGGIVAKGADIPELRAGDAVNGAAIVMASLIGEHQTARGNDEVVAVVSRAIVEDEGLKQIIIRANNISTIYLESLEENYEHSGQTSSH